MATYSLGMNFEEFSQEVYRYIFQCPHTDKKTKIFLGLLFVYVSQENPLELLCMKIKLDDVYNEGKRIRFYDKKELLLLGTMDSTNNAFIDKWDLKTLAATSKNYRMIIERDYKRFQWISVSIGKFNECW